MAATKNDNKTQPNKLSVRAFIDGVEDPARRKDCRALAKLMGRLTGKRAKMWGTTIVGYGSYHYRYASGREGDFFLMGFSPRKQALTIYVVAGFGKFPKLMKRLGKYKTGKSCLYVKSLEDVDMETLEALLQASQDYLRRTYG